MHCTLGHLFDDQLGVGGVVRFQLANNHLALPTKRIATLVRLGRGCGRLLLVMMVATVVFCSLTAHYNRSNCQGDKAYNGKVKKKKKDNSVFGGNCCLRTFHWDTKNAN